MKEKAIYIGKVIRTLRKAKGMTQEGLANEIHLDRSYLSEIERNLKAPSVYTIFKLTIGLGIPPGEMFEKIYHCIDFDSLFEQEFIDPKMDKGK